MVPNASKRRRGKRRFAGKVRGGTCTVCFAVRIDQAVWLKSLDNASEAVRKAIDDLMLAEGGAGGVEIWRSQVEALGAAVKKEEKEKTRLLQADALWDAWERADGQLVLGDDGGLVPKSDRRNDPEVLRALEWWKVHSKNIAEMRKKVRELEAKILSA